MSLVNVTSAPIGGPARGNPPGPGGGSPGTPVIPAGSPPPDHQIPIRLLRSSMVAGLSSVMPGHGGENGSVHASSWSDSRLDAAVPHKVYNVNVQELIKHQGAFGDEISESFVVLVAMSCLILDSGQAVASAEFKLDQDHLSRVSGYASGPSSSAF